MCYGFQGALAANCEEDLGMAAKKTNKLVARGCNHPNLLVLPFSMDRFSYYVLLVRTPQAAAAQMVPRRLGFGL
jgi:hypothetical protein